MAVIDFATNINAQSSFGVTVRLLPLLLNIIASQQAWPDNIIDSSNNLLVRGEFESLGNLYAQIQAATNAFKCAGLQGVSGTFTVTEGTVTVQGGIIVGIS